jgi:hypothetical protein
MFVMTRYIYLSLLIFICIVGAGAILFPDSSSDQQAMLVLAWIVSFTFLHVFDDPVQKREREKRPHDRSTGRHEGR